MKRIGMIAVLAMSMVFAAAAGRYLQSADEVRAALGAKADAAGKASETGIAGKDGWLFFVPELHYLSAGEFWGDKAAKVAKVSNPQWADPFPAILDFKQQLDAMGIDLLVVPVPAKAAIYPDMLVDGAKTDAADRVDQAQGDFVKLLNDNGVHTLDLTPVYLQYRADHPDKPIYSKEDTHWSGTGLDIAAGLIAAEVAKEKWYDGVIKMQFTSAPTQVTAKGDIADMVKSGASGPETFNLTKVTQGGAPIKFDGMTGSPLLLLGDSHCLVYSTGGDLIASNAGLGENLSAKMGFSPDRIAVMGNGATQARAQMLHTPHCLDNKKMVVWVFTARDFTESMAGWRKVPVKAAQ